MTLGVSICTHGERGLLRVAEMLLPPQEDVHYYIAWQDYNEASVPDSIRLRHDVEVYKHKQKGLSRNRNVSIDINRSDIVLISDDDLIFRPDFAKTVIEPFKSDETLDLATFKADFLRKKKYPSRDCKLRKRLPKGYYVTSFEIAFRRNRIGSIRFNPDLGLGAPEMHCGEEEIFLHDAIKKGLNCRFINKTISRHPGETTGDRVSPEILRGHGYVIAALYPKGWKLRIILKAWRMRKKSNIISSLNYLIEGAQRAHNRKSV